jgi:LuxR family transcriptional regulator, positive regulator of biofilm formation
MSPDTSHKYAVIYLVGADDSLNGALSYFFEREICSMCIILKNGDTMPAEISDQGNGKILFLIDCTERDIDKELVALEAKEYLRKETITAALFNLQKGTGIERRAFNKGIKGFFYRTDSLSQMLKGLNSLIRGEMWITRDILVKVALQGRMKLARTVQDKADLTRREIEVLTLLSIGSSNDDIADKLFISSNTVKTHLYRIFRKIKVPNRFQAALWAAKNL